MAKNNREGRLILVLGGVRSGKSRFAEELAAKLAVKHVAKSTLPRASQPVPKVAYLATAQVMDQEMEERVRLHRLRRPQSWTTVECALDAAAAVGREGRDSQVLLLDCLTIYISNLLLKQFHARPGLETAEVVDSSTAEEIEDTVLAEVDLLVKNALASRAAVIVVSNEVGAGVVPDYPLGRLFRDLAGRANQLLAGAADEVYALLAGIPVDIKALSKEQGLL
ncbi:MAG: bifunctional adenosylcobinamide kinase/adenosylcobinamide-phosphate guanylyltransferase [Syntrophothermus sp.]